jgi:hypothetical protein
MNPATQRCKWIAMDGDYKDSLKHLCELQWESVRVNKNETHGVKV